ncbi:MAG: hypothetical protein AB7G65_20330 [Thermoleophilia bacterium]
MNSPRSSRIVLCLCAGAVSLGAGCASAGRGPYSAQSEADRNPLEAQRLSMQAAAILDALNEQETIPPGAPGHAEQLAEHAEQLARAEALLRRALTADLYCGPAHNNLGVVYLAQSPARLYEAASEFAFAQRLMPGAPDPRMNLALTLERAGKLDDALAAYRSALDASPAHLPSIQAIARLQIRHARADDRTRDYLGELALRSDPAWRSWARAQLARGTSSTPIGE